MTHQLSADKIREDALAATGRSLGASSTGPFSGRSRPTSIAWCDTPTIHNLSSEPVTVDSDWHVRDRLLPCHRGKGKLGSGWRLPMEIVRKVLHFIASSRDLRACVCVSRCWRRAQGPSDGIIALRRVNSWQPYSGCWWIPKDAYTLVIVNLHTQDQHRPTAEGLLLRKVYSRRPSLTGTECEIKIERLERRVRVTLTPRLATIKWFVPAKPTEGQRCSAPVEHSVFDCSAVIGLTATSYPTPGKVIPRQLYLANDGGTLKVFPDSHLRRPKSRSAWLDIDAAADQLTEMLERSDWATLKRHPGTAMQPYQHATLSPRALPDPRPRQQSKDSQPLVPPLKLISLPTMSRSRLTRHA